MNGPGYGTPWLRIDHELVGRVLAAKRRLLTERIDFPNPVRPAAAERARKAG